MTPLHSMAALRLLAVVVLLLVGLRPAFAVEVQRVVSPGGIEAWLVEDHTNPIIALQMNFRGGGALDPAGKEGLASMVASTIDEGAGPLDSQGFQGKLNDLSIRLGFSAGFDNFSGTLRSLTENRETAFEMLRLALSEPRFDEEPVERIRAQIAAGLTRSLEDPDVIAGLTLRGILMPEHPYARALGGTLASVDTLTVEDLRRFVAERFARDQLIVGVVGDINAKELARLLDETFMGLPAKAASSEIAEAEVFSGGVTKVVEMDIPQSVAVFGQPGLKREDPDYYTAYVVNYIFGGGGFSSRLYGEVREKRGLAYSVYAYLSPWRNAGLVTGGVATQNARVAESLAVIRDEWHRMADEGPSEAELAHAKTYLTGSFPLRLSSSGAVAGMLVGMQQQDLGIDYLDRRNDFIEAVTLEEARRVARSLYDVDALSVVVVGQPEDLEADQDSVKEDG
jgi:zinc protease